MSVKNNCENICAELRRRGFDEKSEKTSIIPPDALINAVQKQKWSKITQVRYLGATGYLVEFGYIEVVAEGEFKLMGDDHDE